LDYQNQVFTIINNETNHAITRLIAFMHKKSRPKGRLYERV
jgi:hypothetical protein